MKLAGYRRVSTDGQQDGTSLEQQEAVLIKWCRDSGHELVRLFTDADSGESIAGRAAFKSVIRFINEGNADGMVVADFDRFSRSTYDSELIRRAFKKKGKALFSAAQAFDLEDKYGKFIFQVNQSVAELVRAQIFDRCSANRKLKVEKGGWIGNRPQYGFKAVQGALAEDPQEQWVIRLIYRLYTWTNMGQRKVVDYLNKKLESGDERFLPKKAKPTMRARTRPYKKDYTYKWTQGTVSKIIKRRATILGDVVTWEQTKVKRKATISKSRAS